MLSDETHEYRSFQIYIATLRVSVWHSTLPCMLSSVHLEDVEACVMFILIHVGNGCLLIWSEKMPVRNWQNVRK